MTLSTADSASPASGNSPSSQDSQSMPTTPVSPTNPVQTLALPSSDSAAPATSAASQAAKRKPSRRANTAERRATHNAVERQRRETLNSRFLDLAALLPNLSQIRRPSKSAIVNSSIAHIHSSRRHRGMASRELRLLKLEADAIRRELNEWRDRANLPRVEEPLRSEAFNMVLTGEVEMIPVVPGMDDEEDGGDGYGDNDDDFPVGAVSAGHPTVSEDADDFAAAAYLSKAYASAPQLAHILPCPGAAVHNRPVIAPAMSGVSYENPAMSAIYDAHPQLSAQQFQMQQYQMNLSVDSDKNVWNSQLLAAQQQIQQQQQQFNGQQQQGYVTPPTTSHGAAGSYQKQAYFSSISRQGGHIFGSPVDNEDSSSVSSGGHSHAGGRVRSGSMNSSVYGSPPHIRAGSAGSTGSYEMPNGDAFPKRMSAGGAMWGREDLAGLKALGGSQAISVGGGGGNAFAAMMM